MFTFLRRRYLKIMRASERTNTYIVPDDGPFEGISEVEDVPERIGSFYRDEIIEGSCTERED